MKRNFGWILAASLIPGPVSALGLGKLVLDSGLNEPLEARIELLSPTREELDSLAIALADSDAFERAGVERNFVLSGLKFELREGEVGPDFVRVYSRDAIREPFLNFLVEINWSKGRLVREYTVLLDPPLYEPGMRAPVATVGAPSPALGSADTESSGAVSETEAPAAAISYTGGDYGPTQQNDTLWSIASRMRPNDSVSVQQMMLALYRTNPEAFINGNINGLRRGHILRVPPETELSALTREQAFAEALAQNSAWDPSQIAQAATPAPQVAAATPQQPSPAAADAPAPAPTPTPQPSKEAELRLVAPGKGGTGASGEAGAAGKNLDLANEQLSALTQENVDLKDRVAEAETIIEDLKRLIALKDEELAALQKNLADAAARPVAPAPVAAAAAPEAQAAAAKTPEPVQEVKAPPPQVAETKPEAAKPEAAAPEPAPAKEAPATTPAKSKPEAAPAAKPPETALGVLVEPVIIWLKGNLMIIGAALGALVVVIAGLLFVSRRKQASAVAAEDEAAAAVQFPDFAGSEEETILPGAAAEAAPAPEIEKRGAAARPEVKPAPVAAKPSQAAAPPPAPAPEAPQEDPLAEVNVFLAYEHFDQAEQFVREAITREPDNLDFHSKLLEVFYAANDRRKYEQAAKVLHDKVGGSGPHWDMALVMWKEISPNRVLFSEPAADEDQAPAPAAGVGMLDLTTKEMAAPADDGSLDFDLGEMTAEPAAQAAASDAASDVLDVTASVGLGTDEEMLSVAAGEREDVLDLTGGQGGEESLPDPGAAPTGDDLLDVTSHSNLDDAGLDADPLDVTVAAPSSITDDAPAAPKPAADAGNSMDFDLSLDAAEPAVDDNAIEFESGLGQPDSDAGAGGLELDLSAGIDSPADGDAGLDLDMGSGKDDDLGLSLDVPGADDAGAGELSLEMPGGEAGGLDLSFDAADTGAAGELSLEDLAEEGSDQTVFVPRTDGTQAQSAEDEIATKLDLAKAYVELGDKSSARGILDEIAAEGNEEQRRQAEELRQQAS